MWRGLGAPPLTATTRFLATRVARQPLGRRRHNLDSAAHPSDDDYALRRVIAACVVHFDVAQRRCHVGLTSRNGDGATRPEGSRSTHNEPPTRRATLHLTRLPTHSCSRPWPWRHAGSARRLRVPRSKGIPLGKATPCRRGSRCVTRWIDAPESRRSYATRVLRSVSSRLTRLDERRSGSPPGCGGGCDP